MTNDRQGNREGLSNMTSQGPQPQARKRDGEAAKRADDDDDQSRISLLATLGLAFSSTSVGSPYGRVSQRQKGRGLVLCSGKPKSAPITIDPMGEAGDFCCETCLETAHSIYYRGSIESTFWLGWKYLPHYSYPVYFFPFRFSTGVCR